MCELSSNVWILTSNQLTMRRDIQANHQALQHKTLGKKNITEVFSNLNVKPIAQEMELTLWLVRKKVLPTICQTCMMLSSETLQMTQASLGFQEKSDIFAV